MRTMLSGRQEPTEYHGLPVPQVREAKDARTSMPQPRSGEETIHNAFMDRNFKL
jgi:hypothetical protein